MNLHNLDKAQLLQLKENFFKLEREVQNLFRQNLLLLTGSAFVIKINK